MEPTVDPGCTDWEIQISFTLLQFVQDSDNWMNILRRLCLTAFEDTIISLSVSSWNNEWCVKIIEATFTPQQFKKQHEVMDIESGSNDNQVQEIKDPNEDKDNENKDDDDIVIDDYMTGGMSNNTDNADGSKNYTAKLNMDPNLPPIWKDNEPLKHKSRDGSYRAIEFGAQITEKYGGDMINYLTTTDTDPAMLKEQPHFSQLGAFIGKNAMALYSGYAASDERSTADGLGPNGQIKCNQSHFADLLMKRGEIMFGIPFNMMQLLCYTVPFMIPGESLTTEISLSNVFGNSVLLCIIVIVAPLPSQCS